MDIKEDVKLETEEITVSEATDAKPAKKEKKKKEKEWRKVKGISPMAFVVPFIMVNRNGASNKVRDSVDIERVEKYIKENALCPII